MNLLLSGNQPSVAMENGRFIDDFPSKPPFIGWEYHCYIGLPEAHQRLDFRTYTAKFSNMEIYVKLINCILRLVELPSGYLT